MSELVKRLRIMAEPTSTDNEWSTIGEAAARIEALEAENRKLEIEKIVAETNWAYVCGKLAALTNTPHEFALPHLRPEFERGFREAARAALKQD